MKLAAIIPFLFMPFSLALPIDGLEARTLEVRETKNAAIDRLLFHSSMPTFQSARRAKRPSNLIWTSDGCTGVPDKPLGFNFLPSCQRHDFGYRNYKYQHRFTSSNRKKIDDGFLRDLLAECINEGLSGATLASCRGLANEYYDGVRTLGGLTFDAVEAADALDIAE